MTDHFDEIWKYVEIATEKYFSKGTSEMNEHEIVLVSI